MSKKANTDSTLTVPHPTESVKEEPATNEPKVKKGRPTEGIAQKLPDNIIALAQNVKD